MTKHVAVLMGGLSPEREVSFMTGKSVCEALAKLGYKVSQVDPDRDVHNKLKELKPDVVFNALHGTYGEDGVIPGILEMIGVPYTHSGVMASAIGLNKSITKSILREHNIRIPQGFEMTVADLYQQLKAGRHPMEIPYVVKPVQQGSSVGVTIVLKESDIASETFSPENWHYGDTLIIEKYIPGKELSTCVVGDKAIGTLELRPVSGFYDYTAKYTDGKTDHIYPAEVPEEIYKQSLEYAEAAHKYIGCRSVSRTDMRYDEKQNLLYVLEINTHPGFTSLSIVPDIAARNGMPFEQLVDKLVKEARCDIKS